MTVARLRGRCIGVSSSGRTLVFGTSYGGSNPSTPAIEYSRPEQIIAPACLLTCSMTNAQWILLILFYKDFEGTCYYADRFPA